MGIIGKGLEIATKGQISFESEKILADICSDEKARAAVFDYLQAHAYTSYWFGVGVALTGVVIGGVAADFADDLAKKVRLWNLKRRIKKLEKALKECNVDTDPAEETEDEPDEA